MTYEFKHIDVEILSLDTNLQGCRAMKDCNRDMIKITVPHAPGHTASVIICKKHAEYLRDLLTEAIDGLDGLI